jgi:Flp pilus assembly protein TadB
MVLPEAKGSMIILYAVLWVLVAIGMLWLIAAVMVLRWMWRRSWSRRKRSG